VSSARHSTCAGSVGGAAGSVFTDFRIARGYAVGYWHPRLGVTRGRRSGRDVLDRGVHGCSRLLRSADHEGCGLRGREIFGASFHMGRIPVQRLPPAGAAARLSRQVEQQHLGMPKAFEVNVVDVR
jgi:hypothetical protein